MPPTMEKSNTLEYINSVFPSEASLSGVEPMMQKIQDEIRQVDAEILAAVRKQSNSGSKAKEDLAAATEAIKELMGKIREIKSKAEQSETMVQEICRDIKKLDFAKKHITTTITALHRLAMLVSAVEQLQEMASKRQYKEAAGQLEAVNQLCNHFEAYRDVPKISELREKFRNIKQVLKSHVFSDFSSLGTARLKEDSNLMQQLADACLVVDALEPTVREELIKTVCSKELTTYQQIFEGTEVAKLDKAERRYAWIKRQLRANEDIWQIFPASWKVPYLLCIQFCKVTRTQLTDILNSLKEKPDVGILLQALQRTLEFEQELAERFGESVAQTTDVESDTEESENVTQNGSRSAELKKKYEKRSATAEGKEGNINKKNSDSKEVSTFGAGFNFHGIISSCFEPHLSVYVELEEKTLMENLEKLIQEEKWEAEERSQTNVLSSSTQVFLIIKRSLKRCSALTKNQTLFNLFKVFQRVLRAYAGKLSAKLPKGSTGIVATATGTDQIKTSDKDERVICYIVNTAEYCHETAGQLAESISKIIDPQFAEKVDMSEEQDEFSAVITRALMTLVHGLETKLEIELLAMTRVPWSALESVGDHSGYVNGISAILSSSVPTFGGLLSPLYFQFFLDKLAASLAPRFYLNIYKCKHISETGAQQMLLDTHAVKTILLEVPSVGKNAASTGYNKFVNREMGKAEALLKVILSPVESVADTFRALMPEGTAAEFQRILELKGLKKTEHQTLLEDFSRHGVGMMAQNLSISQPRTVVAAPVSPVAPSPTTTALINRGDDVLTRAAALGRGAATTGFKRFLALTEAAKDRKDSPFRKLFNNT